MTCTCNYGDGESGPHLCVDVDEQCPEHGRAACPEERAESDREGAMFEAARLVSVEHAVRRSNPGVMDASVVRALAKQSIEEEDAYYAAQYDEFMRERTS